MHKKLIKTAIENMSNDTNIVRLTFLTSFFHSLIVTLFMILNTNKLLVDSHENGVYISKISQFLIQEINKNYVVSWIVAITILLFLLYSIIYPIGQAAIIHYMHRWKSIKHSIKSVLPYFFSMFEFGFIALIFSPISFFITAYRVLILWKDIWFWTFFIFAIWFLVMIVVNILKVYTRYFIVLQQMPLYEALKTSIGLAWKNFWETRRYMTMQTLLLINFSFNIVLIIGIPFLLIYLSISWDIIGIWWIKLIVYFIFFFLIILSAYMSSFIRAFFAYYWYELYKKIKNLS